MTCSRVLEYSERGRFKIQTDESETAHLSFNTILLIYLPSIFNKNKNKRYNQNTYSHKHICINCGW